MTIATWQRADEFINVLDVPLGGVAGQEVLREEREISTVIESFLVRKPLGSIARAGQWRNRLFVAGHVWALAGITMAWMRGVRGQQRRSHGCSSPWILWENTSETVKHISAKTNLMGHCNEREKERGITRFLISVLLFWWLALEAFGFFGLSEVDFLGKSPIRFVHPTLYLKEKTTSKPTTQSSVYMCNNIKSTIICGLQKDSTYLFAHTVEQNRLDLLKLNAKSRFPQNSHASTGSAIWLFSSSIKRVYIMADWTTVWASVIHQVCD